MKQSFSIFLGILLLCYTRASAAVPTINCGGLPGCDSGGIDGEESIYNIIGNFISLMIQYTAVIAVIAVMVGGIMYLLSGGDDEKISHAKKTIIWAMVGVLVSVLAWSVINILNNFVL